MSDQDSLVYVQRALEQIEALVIEATREMGVLSGRMEGIEKAQEKTAKILTEGNGTPPLMTRVSLVERSLVEMSSKLDQIQAQIEQLDKTKISADIEPPLSPTEQVQIAKSKASRARWAALKVLLGGGVGIGFLTSAYAYGSRVISAIKSWMHGIGGGH